MKAKTINLEFDRDREIISKFYENLSEFQQDDFGGITACASDYLIMLIDEFDDIKNTIKVNNFALLPKNKDESISVNAYLKSYLAKNHFNLQADDLEKEINLYQKETPLSMDELWFVSTCLRLILFHRFAQIAKNVLTKQVQKTDYSDFKNIISSILEHQKIDWKIFFEATSLVEKILRQDPADIYSLMDFATRKNYCNEVKKLSQKTGKSEVNIAEKAVESAARLKLKNEDHHVGIFLLGEKRDIFKREIGYKCTWWGKLSLSKSKTHGKCYFLLLFSIVFISLFLIVLMLQREGFLKWQIIVFSLLCLIPTIISVENLLNFLFSLILTPKVLPKMDFHQEIPLWARTMLVIPTQFGTDSREPENLLSQLENNYINNQVNNLYFALLLAPKDSQEENVSISSLEKANLKKIKDGIKQLNQKYSKEKPQFFLFFRPRIWNEQEALSLEWERKRGKLIEFNRLLRGGETTFDSSDFDFDFFKTIKYVITIDQNDLLPKETAQKLVATISHPLNRARNDTKRQITDFGYGIIQPGLSSRKRTSSSLLGETFCADAGWDSYSGVASNIYQDVFGSGLYLGSGIYDVDTMNEVLDHRFPENTILSHDHLEGFYGRTGYVSDIQIYEDTPTKYSAYLTRSMRWIRGDWQNLPRVFGLVKDEAGNSQKNPLGFFERFKLLENSVESLFLPSIFLAFLILVFIHNGPKILLVFLYLVFLLFQPFLSLISSIITHKITSAWRESILYFKDQLKGFSLQILFRVLFTSHIAISTLFAISKTLYRMIISKKHLLEWQIFSNSGSSQKNSTFRRIFDIFYFYEMFWIIILVLIIYLRDLNLYSGVFIGLSMFAPFWADIFSRDLIIQKREVIAKSWFNCIALKTWRYFEETVSEKTNYLPPDKWQVDDNKSFSQMTSITNIGLYLLSLDTAFSSGYISLIEYFSCLEKTFVTLDKMDRFHGHFYNWYDINTIAAMSPKYISTVDSGNFASSLITMEQRLLQLRNVDICDDVFWDSLEAVLTITLKAINYDLKKHREVEVEKCYQDLHSVLKSIPRTSQNVRDFYFQLQDLSTIITDCLSLFVTKGKTNNLRYWSNKLLTLMNGKIAEIELFYPWLMSSQGGKELSFSRYEIHGTLGELDSEISKSLSLEKTEPFTENMMQKSRLAINSIFKTSDNIKDKCRSLYEDMDFRFLYDKKKKLFYIAYNSTTETYNRNHYDLLASEARLTSFIAIALNQLPLEHWQSLSRPVTVLRGKYALLSWGGSLFEYLFPQIFLQNVSKSFITESLTVAVTDQINFAKQNGIPWGISESCFDIKNAQGDFQYFLNGTPNLSLRPTLRTNLIVSPYSSFLALEFHPEETYENLQRLKMDGAEGKYGFYEAIDYKKSLSAKLRGKPIRAFLSHHQSIILLSIYNFLHNGELRNSFNQHPAISSLNYIVSEKAPIYPNLRSAYKIAKEVPQNRTQSSREGLEMKVNIDDSPLVNIISNGKYRTYITNRGQGFCQFNNININPRCIDQTLGVLGNQLYIWDEKDQRLISPNFSRLLEDEQKQTVELSENMVSFKQINRDLTIKLTVGLVEDENMEYRILTLKNSSFKRKSIKVAFASEQILANGFEDTTHSAFNRLKTKVEEENGYLIYSRRQMLSEKNIYVGHKSLTSHSPQESYVITSRRDFLGRLPDFLPSALTNDKKAESTSGFDLIYGDITRIKLFPLSEFKIIYLSTASFSKAKVIEQIGEYKHLTDIEHKLQGTKKSNIHASEVDLLILHKLLSLLLYRRPKNTTNVFNQNNKVLGLPEIKNTIGANLDNPILFAIVDNEASKTTFQQLTNYAQALAKKGFGLNFVVLTIDGGEYFRNNSIFVESLLLSADSQEKSVETFSNLIIIKEGEHIQEEIESLKALSTLFVDLKSGSFINQVESEYDKL